MNDKLGQISDFVTEFKTKILRIQTARNITVKKNNPMIKLDCFLF